MSDGERSRVSGPILCFDPGGVEAISRGSPRSGAPPDPSAVPIPFDPGGVAALRPLRGRAP
jgi:hypothetical protein